MKILITGANGNLGRRLMKDFSHEHEVVGVDIDRLDITDREAVHRFTPQINPDAIINAAAFTAVDKCEDQIDLAYAVNAVAVRNLCEAANDAGARFVHYSTDFVFDGERTEGGYREFDPVNPLSIYGKSKYAGEVEATRHCPNSIILRVAWLYGPGGWNFSDWVAEQTTQGNEIRIVTDQFGCPTWVGDVSAQTQSLLEAGASGIYHSVNTGSCSRYDWALEAARIAGGDVNKIKPITSEEFPQKAPRPKYSVLDNFYLKTQRLERMRPWQEALQAHLTDS
ncbi:MAG: dTDP-4-dehydrorhamnose reductase [Candidatus Omnitrophica bacterium]|nr:dTDP-4-dehydrorhamnose reductase [Candidatus Omnitrophota bacterium]